MRGVTLIEAIIYFALTSALIAGVLASTYPLFTNTERLSASIVRDLESAFVFQKISYLMNQGTAIAEPAAGSSGSVLRISVAGGDVYRIKILDGVIALSRNSANDADFKPLTAAQVPMTNLTFTRTPGTGGAPETLTIDFEADGVSEGPYTRYVRF